MPTTTTTTAQQPQQQQKTISPVDGSVCVTRPLATVEEAFALLDKAAVAQRQWRQVPLQQRGEIVLRMVQHMVDHADDIGREISQQMGRPVRYTRNEVVKGFADRARHMVSIAADSLRDKQVSEAEAGSPFKRYIKREPLGVCLVIPAWNYPLLTAVNGIVPALLAGNAVLLKHSQQTPLCAERLYQAFVHAGLPDGVFQFVHMSHQVTDQVIRHPVVAFVNFTGSVAGGRSVQASATANKFITCGLELGGKDPAYVCADANLADAVENLVDGAMFNSGQCCCGIERIYVDAAIYDQFVEQFVALTKKYVLGDPLDPATTLGPMVKVSAADLVREHIADAVAKGAKALIDPALFPRDKVGTAYLAPQVLVNVDHTMKVMTEETFGPVVGIMRVESEAEAVRLMNDSEYGLTAAVWTQNQAAAIRVGDQIETGTVFQNRCDYVDPALAWTGVKNTGYGCTLSEFGFLQLTRPKSYHLRTIA